MVDRAKAYGYTFRHIKGPMHARQLGRCLIAEVVVDSYCNLDCVYCPLERVRNLNQNPRSLAVIDDIREEVKRKLHIRQELDYVVLTGQGEPTLHPNLNAIAAWFEAHVEARIALITNGTHLHAPYILHGINRVDQIMLSLDAVDEASFRQVMRPAIPLSFADHFKNLLTFRDTYQHRLWLQIFLVRGVTLTRPHVDMFADCIRRLRPDHVLLTMGPLPQSPGLRNDIPLKDRKRLAAYLTEATGVLTEMDDLYDGAQLDKLSREIFELLEQQPLSLNVLAQNVDRTLAETEALLVPMIDAGAIVTHRLHGAPHYYLSHDWRRPSLKYQRVREEQPLEIDFRL